MRWVLLVAAVVVEVTLAPTCASAKALPSGGMIVQECHWLHPEGFQPNILP
jgi:hypothetical protein